MTEIQAAIGLCQLGRLEEITRKRRANAAFLDRAIDPARFPRPRVLPGHRHVYHQYVVRVPRGSGMDRLSIQQELERAGVGSAVHYPVPVHLQPPYLAMGETSLPCAEAAAREILSIPVHPLLTQSDLERIAEAFRRL
jgi:perosamine synthetase